MIDYSALKNEIATDLKALGYAALVASGNDQGIADLLNATTGSGAATVGLTSLTKDEFVLGFAPAIYTNLSTLSTTKQQQWRDILNIINGATAVDLSTSNVQALLAQGVSDGLITQAEINAVTQKTGSRAEFLFGAGTVISNSDVSFALRGVH